MFTFGEYGYQNGTEIFACYALDDAGNWMSIWGTVNLVYVTRCLIYFKH